MSRPSPFTFYEFFCGGGMARTGLGSRWRCLFANDLDQAKGRDGVAAAVVRHLAAHVLEPLLTGRPDAAAA